MTVAGLGGTVMGTIGMNVVPVHMGDGRAATVVMDWQWQLGTM